MPHTRPARFRESEPSARRHDPGSPRSPAARVTWAKRDELGEATANLIASYVQDPRSFPYVNRRLLPLGSPEFSLQETVVILGRAVGRAALVFLIFPALYAPSFSKISPKSGATIAVPPRRIASHPVAHTLATITP